MQYQSTRDKNISVDSAVAIKTGLSSDGGLFVPNCIPSVKEDDIKLMSTLNYNERAAKILSLFLTDFTTDEIIECVDKAYSKEKFETVDIAPIYKLKNSTYFLELWHGPTCAFKDMALQILPHLLLKSVKKTGETKEIVILVATSGDTGKAALEGFKNVDGTRIIVFYPENGVSHIQKLQMATQDGNNVDVAAINGNFDDAQTGVKTIFSDKEYAKVLEQNSFMLSSANSINWGRLVPQIIYYFSAYCNLLRNDEIELGESINFVVPTGNFGNILAAYYAREMGLPINKLICASNKNNILTDFINTGVYDKNRNFHTTTSPSMDILISSNLERLLYHITGGDDTRVKTWMNELKDSGKYEIPEVTKEKIKRIFWAGFCDDIDTTETIKNVKNENGYVIDTHTAVAKNVYDQYISQTEDKHKTVIVSTASPFKFANSVLNAVATQEEIEGKDDFELLDILSQKAELNLPQSLAELKTKPVIFKTTCEKNELYEVVSNMLNLA